jgi:opacity protein-like surface antigen
MSRRIAAAFTLASLGCAPLAAAQDFGSEAWSARFTLYGWLPSISGSQSGPDEVPFVNLDSTSVFDALEGAFFGTAEIRKGRIGFLLDYVYADLASDGTTRRLDLPVDVGTTVSMGTFALAYRVHEREDVSVDVFGGARPFSVEASGSLTLPVIGEIDRGTTVEWVDPLIGVRGHYQFAEDWGFTTILDVGGFQSDDTSWEAIATVDYAFNDTVSALLGYRYLSIDYESDEAKLDLDLQGPMLGVAFSF